MAIWRRPKLTARGDPDHDHVAAQIVARLLELPRRPVVLAGDETHLNLLSAYDLTCRSAYDLTCWFAGSLAG